MKYKKYMAVLWSGIILFSTACSTQNEIQDNQVQTEQLTSTTRVSDITTTTNSNVEETAEEMIPELSKQRIERIITDNVFVLADVDIPEKTILNSYANTRGEIDLDSIIQIFLTETDNVTDRREFEQEGKTIFVETESGNMISATGVGTINFSTPNAGLYRQYNTPELRQSKQNQFLVQEHTYKLRSEIETEFQLLLDSLQVDTDHIQIQLEIFAIDYQSLFQEQERMINEPGFMDFVDMGKAPAKDNWSEHDNIYYSTATGNVQIDGIRLSHSTFDLQDMRFVNPAFGVEMITSNQGIEDLHITNELGSLQIKESGEIVTIEDILSSLENRFANIIVPTETTFENIYVEYVNIPNKDGNGYTLTPVWSVYGYENVEMEEGQFMEFPYSLYFDAFTGEEIR